MNDRDAVSNRASTTTDRDRVPIPARAVLADFSALFARVALWDFAASVLVPLAP